MTDKTADPRRRTFAPLMLLGLASSALLAVACSRALLVVPDTYWDQVGIPAASDELVGSDAGELPLAAALSLVLLAAWGVMLVTRGFVRRGVAVIALLAAVGALVAVIVGWSGAADGLRADLADLAGLPGGGGEIPVERTGWWWTAIVAGVLATLSTGLAVWQVPGWPEMGQRYDAPVAAESTGVRGRDGVEDTPSPAKSDPAERAEGDLWRDIDAGHDPTE